MTSRLILPLPPSVNHSHTNINRGGRLMRVKSTEATTFIDEAGWATKVWMQKTKWQTPDKKAKVIVNVWIFWKDNRRRDADNTFKLLLDSMKGIAFQDDSQVLPRVMDYNVDKQNPRIEIELRVMEAV